MTDAEKLAAIARVLDGLAQYGYVDIEKPQQLKDGPGPTCWVVIDGSRHVAEADAAVLDELLKAGYELNHATADA